MSGEQQTLEDALTLLGKYERTESAWPDGPKVFAGTTAAAFAALNTLTNSLKRAEAALAEIEAKPYRAEEVTARYRRETR